MLPVAAITVLLQLSNLSGAPSPIVASAQADVVRIYATAGVDVVWAPAAATDDARAIHVILLPFESGALRRSTDTVMGSAVRTEWGNRVAYVYYRRIEEQAALHDAARERVLAYAIAHELGHLLGTRDHSPTGVMRACWRHAEFRQVADGALAFSSRETAMLHALENRPSFDGTAQPHGRK